MKRFEITNKEIVPLYIWRDLKIGGVVDFIGRVRNVNYGREVLSLEYEAYEALAFSEGEVIIEEALLKFDIREARAIHRTGHLQIGEIAVYVSTAAVHRVAAFQATEYIIREVKKRVPVWKKEHYSQGEPEWVACHHCAG